MRDTRIQKALSELGVCSRRAAEQMIADGRVLLNGRPVSLGDKMDMKTDVVSVDGRSIRAPKRQKYIYEMLNKPRGYITTASDERGRKTVMELVADIPERIYPIGRLDKESEGLLLFTNDGDFANSIMHPSAEVGKMYRVSIRHRATEEQISALEDGVRLEDGTMTSRAAVRVVADEPDRMVFEVTIHEGKNREIRRMFEALGLEVIRLKRNAEGPVRLGMLQPGKHRPLTAEEIASLRAAAGKGRKRSRAEQQNGQPRSESEGRVPHDRNETR